MMCVVRQTASSVARVARGYATKGGKKKPDAKKLTALQEAIAEYRKGQGRNNRLLHVCK